MQQSVDVLLTGVTGFVGRFVLYELVTNKPNPTVTTATDATDTTDATNTTNTTSPPPLKIAVIIRSRGTQTAIQRWQREIVNSTMFAGLDLSHVYVIDAAIENIETTTHHLSTATRIIHCAANVKHYDPYESLERDNVGNVERILALSKLLSCQTLILLSTCYVHPREATGPRTSERISTSTNREDFYNDYCYTKWQGEERVFETPTGIPNIALMRLSCVGAPVRAAAHPFAAQAHLGLITFVLRGYLECLATKPTSRISVVPVDIAATAIVGAAFAAAEAAETNITIHQICPPPQLTEYHLSIPEIVAYIRDQCGLEGFVSLLRNNTEGIHLPLHRQLMMWATKRGRDSLELHTKIQDFVRTFTDDDIRFESSIPVEQFPTHGSYVADTCQYAIRIVHDRQMKKGVPISLSDRFWTRLANHEPVQICLTLQTPISWSPALQARLWHVMSGHRKYMARLDDSVWRLTDTVGGYFSEPIWGDHVWSASDVLIRGLQLGPMPHLWHMTPVGLQESGITHILIRGDHGLTDGIGAFPVLQDLKDVFADAVGPKDATAVPTSLRSLPWWLDIWLGLVYVALLVTAFLTSPQQSKHYSHVPTIATNSISHTDQAKDGSTYTSRLLWSVTQSIAKATGENDILLAIPAVTKSERRAVDMPTNSFTPVIMPVSAKMSNTEFESRCRLLHSKTVRFISWCIQQILEYTQADGLRDALLSRITAIVSSVPINSLTPTGVTAIHGVTTTPAPIPISILAISNNEQVTHLSVRSHRSDITADKILQGITAMTKK